MSPRTRARLGFAFGALAVAYVLLCLTARVVYPSILFPAPRAEAVPAELSRAGGPQLLELAQTHGGATRALLWRAPDGARTVVLFHGNGQTMFDEAPTAEALVARGVGVMLVEYRGYGITYGAPPTEDGMYDDAEAALRFLAEHGAGRERVALWGFSLGTGVAAEMAKRDRAARVVLVAPYTSIVDMGKRWAPILPVGLIMSHRFATLEKAKDIRAPTLVIHGDADEVVPFAMGEAVAHALPHGRLERAPGAHHMDVLQAPDVFDEAVRHVKSD